MKNKDEPALSADPRLFRAYLRDFRGKRFLAAPVLAADRLRTCIDHPIIGLPDLERPKREPTGEAA